MEEMLTQAEIFRYSRHMLLPKVGLEGQQKLKNTSVLIVGVGGLGSSIALYLAAAGIGPIGLVDYDVVEESNLQRQVIHSSEWVGKPKVESARQRLLALNPYIEVRTNHTVLTAENARQIASEYDILVDGTDNFPTRYLLNDLGVLTGKPFVYGSVFRYEGQVSVFDSRRGPCYRCLFPEPPPPESAPGCSEAGVFSVLPGTIGAFQATEVIKLALSSGEPLIGRLLLYDALEMSFEIVHLRKNPNCKICGNHPDITHLINYEAFCSTPARGGAENLAGEGRDVYPLELAGRLRRGEGVELIDVRDPVEQQVSVIAGARSIPLEQILQRSSELDPDQEYVFFCRTGTRSARVVRLLSGAGFKHAKNLVGGINAWAEQVEPSLQRY